MNKREFIKAVMRGDKAEALHIKNRLLGNVADRGLTVVYKTPMSQKRTPQEKVAFERFVKKTQSQHPNKEILFITVAYHDSRLKYPKSWNMNQ